MDDNITLDIQAENNHDVPMSTPSLLPPDDPDEIGTGLREAAISDSIRSSFSTAAHILQRAMGLDGVVFLDAALSDFASRSDRAVAINHLKFTSGSTMNYDTDGTSDDEREVGDESGLPGKRQIPIFGRRMSQDRISGRLGVLYPSHPKTQMTTIYLPSSSRSPNTSTKVFCNDIPRAICSFSIRMKGRWSRSAEYQLPRSTGRKPQNPGP